MKLEIHEEATAELLAAVEWYEQARTGLGEAMLAEATRVVTVVAASPAIWARVPAFPEVRQFLFTRFPYTAYYVIRQDHILVLAFAHRRREPRYWLGRRPETGGAEY